MRAGAFAGLATGLVAAALIDMVSLATLAATRMRWP
jgi:hypothetical protein